MNQKMVIYIILSAILLYLYYRKKDFMIFAAFVVMVAGTMFASKREGFGFGDGKGDKACAKLGFTAPKIDKKDINGGLGKILNNFKKVVEKYADVGENGIDIKKSEEDFKALNEVMKLDSAKDIITKWEKDGGNDFREFFRHSHETYYPYIFRPSEESQKELVNSLPRLKEKFKKIINGGNGVVKMLEDIKKLDEMKQLDKKAKDFLDAVICAFKQSVLIWKSLDKASGGGGGEEEKPTKKKKSTKKKSKKDDEDADAEDE
jgi:hypothetical protein